MIGCGASAAWFRHEIGRVTPVDRPSPNHALRPDGAGVDVWVDEPPSMEHPLLAMDNVIATYHTAGITVDSRLNMANWNAEQIVDTLQGRCPPRLINPEAWPKFCERFEKLFGFRPQGQPG